MLLIHQGLKNQKEFIINKLHLVKLSVIVAKNGFLQVTQFLSKQFIPMYK
jgi:hypothetical protein